MVLQLNGANNLTLSANGTYTFTATLANSASYAVSFNSLPSTQVCAIANASGAVAAANVTNVNITCATPSVAGSVSGLTGTGLVLRINDTSDLAVSSNGAFAFPTGTLAGNTGAPAGVAYTLKIKTQPSGQTCTIIKSLGVVNVQAPTSSVASVACTANVTDPLSGTYQLTLSGFTGRAFITFYPDGTYIFGVHSDDPSCTANNGNGVEYGIYKWNQTTHVFTFVTVAVDTNGDCGIANGASHAGGTLIKNLDGSLSGDFLDTNGSGAHVLPTFTPVPSTSGALIGSWSGNAFTGQIFTAYSSNGTYFAAVSTGAWFNGALVVNTSPGIEDGCYLLSGTNTVGSFSTNVTNTCAVSGTQVGVDTNGTAFGLSPNTASNPLNFIVSGNTLETWSGPSTNPHAFGTRN